MVGFFSQRLVEYKFNNNIPIIPFDLSVIIQNMISSDTSGVAFTANPVTGQRDHGIIEACFGLGEGIVSGTCDTDRFVFNLSKRIPELLEKDIHEKILMVQPNEKGNGTETVKIPAKIQNKPSLNEEDAIHLATIIKQISAEKGFPQDIEWAISNGTHYILQTRPITALPPTSSNKVVWDNSNIQESYCGVTTPLTYSFARKAYETVYRQTMTVLGVSPKVIKYHESMLRNMLGLSNGRIYYNINNWYKGLLLLPSFKHNKEDMERMMGIEHSIDFIHDVSTSLLNKIANLPQMIKRLINLLIRFKKMPQSVSSFQSEFEEVYLMINRDELHRKDPTALWSLINLLDKKLLGHWETPIVNDFLVMMSGGQVRRILEKACVKDIEALTSGLLSSQEELASTEPTKFLIKISDYIRGDEELSKIFLSSNTDIDSLLESIQHKDNHLFLLCQEYIEKFGDRCMGELKLESISLREDPRFMFTVIKNYIKNPDLTSSQLGKCEYELRANSEETAFNMVKKVFGNRALRKFKRKLKSFRKSIADREQMRMSRTRMFGLYRSIFLEIGCQFAFHGALENSRDIFYLSLEELKSYFEGSSYDQNIKNLTKSRKSRFKDFETDELPGQFKTNGPVYLHKPINTIDAPKVSSGSKLKGTGCFPGIVTSPIRLIFSPAEADDIEGQILCTVRTDPGWAPLFPTAGGLLVERGSTLSHSAIVARELGIPAIVGIPGLTSILESGETVTIDGSTGIIIRQTIDE
jgi:rifampicin phosphotransferase